MGTEVQGGQSYKNLSASGQVKATGGVLCGIFVASTSAATVKLWDNTAATGAILINTHTIGAGWNAMPFQFNNALFLTIAGTADMTVSYS